MHKMIVAVLSLTLSGWALAAEPAVVAKTSPKQNTKAVPAKHAAVKTKVQVAKVAVKAAPVAAAATAAAIALSPVADAKVQEAVAASVHTGHMVCELGNSVTVTPDPQQPSRFIVQMKKYTYHMTPVETTTGAVRLEDAQAGAMWLQLQNKSMLMNSKLGQRMADECQNDHQVTVAQAMKLNPPPSLLDSPTLAKK
jgi:hypothetical protein